MGRDEGSLEPGVKGRQEVECPLEGTMEQSRDLAGRRNREGLKGTEGERLIWGKPPWPRGVPSPPSSHSSQAGDFLFTPHLHVHAKSHQPLAVPHLVYRILTHTARSG